MSEFVEVFEQKRAMAAFFLGIFEADEHDSFAIGEKLEKFIDRSLGRFGFLEVSPISLVVIEFFHRSVVGTGVRHPLCE